MNLTESQLKAIRYSGRNLQLVACAGSGKTEVVARRIVHLLSPERPDPLLPRNIVAFTFTDKAAAELKERVLRRTHETLGDVPGMAEMFIGTIHGFCLELLKTETAQYLKYEVLNEVQQVLFTDRHSQASGLTTSTALDGTALKRFRDTTHYLSALSILREAELNDTKLLECSLLEGLIKYSNLLHEKRYLDYTSILSIAAETLENNASVRAALGGRIKYAVVDEYQDVNPIQERIVRALHDLGARLCVVGDDDQTIYQWRGSNVQNILTFSSRYPDVAQVALEENFRSSDAIVETARTFIAQNTERLPKAMVSTGAQPTEIGDVVALSFPDAESEARHIASTITSLRGVAFRDGDSERGLAWSDMAVLVRAKKSAKPIIDALKAANVRYVVTGMTNLFEAPEAEAARQLFYFMGSHGDITESMVASAWRAAHLGISDKALEAAVRQAAESKAALNDPDVKRWSQYNIQRVFLAFLETAELRVERVPNGGGDLAFYNLGKFSQVISDYEAIHFHSKPVEKYPGFAKFLEHGAEDAYPEGKQDDQYANPDAVRIMTIHQAKGMQWPVVFIPSLLKNRFPAKKPGGRNVWHLLPKDGIRDQARYEGSLEDERRLFYVAMTRSQKFLHLTSGPVSGNQLYQKVSPFYDDVLISPAVKRKHPDYAGRPRRDPRPRIGVANVTFSFSDLKYFFECPYQFKLRILYGFNAPLHEALGYGKSLHDALADLHRRALNKDFAGPSEAETLVQTHLHAPYAYPALRDQLRIAAERVVRSYIQQNASDFKNIEFAEKQIGVELGDGVSITGRIDLVRRRDTSETTIVDLKSSDRAQAEEVTDTQLHIYALGYQELTGRRPDFVETYELDAGKRKPRAVDDDFMADVRTKTRGAAAALRTGELPPTPERKKCDSCDYCGMCTAGQQARTRKG